MRPLCEYAFTHIIEEQDMKNKNMRKITLVTTKDCNMKCKYCYETHKSQEYMSFDTAKAVIDSELARFPSDAIIKIEMIGGEPFLPEAFELFKNAVDYTDSAYPDKNISYIVTTNGTLVHGEVQDFLKKHSSQITLSLSLDGRKRSHDLNRPMKNGKSGFDSIDIEFFRSYPIKVNAKMTVSPLTLKYLADDIIYVSEELELIPTATLASGIPWEKDFIAEELIDQLGILVDYYSKNTELPLPLMLLAELEGVFAKPDPHCKPCGAGEVTRAFSPDCIDKNGNISWYPCQGLAPISLGDDAARQFKNCTFAEFTLNEPCASCKFRALCHACQATNFGVTGDVGSQSEVMCLMNRLCALAASKICFNRMAAKGFSKLSVEDQVALKAVSIIQSEIFDNEKHEFLWKYEAHPIPTNI
jgi:uncharacterized protein